MTAAKKKCDRNERGQSGYTSCPCCGYDTISDDVTEPEMCSECEEAGCEEDEPACEMHENAHDY
jgi:hypothetical protein